MTLKPLVRRAAAGYAAVAVALLAVGLTSCDDTNAWTDLPTGSVSGTDATPPSIEIELPDSAHRVAPGDSVLVRVHVTDNISLDSVAFAGFALRGSAALGTLTRVDRFIPKFVSLRDSITAVQDTVITRYLLPTDDSIAESPILIVANARDEAGHTAADTVRVSIGGPHVQIVEPAVASRFRAGTQMPVRVVASDTAGKIGEISLRATGAFASDTVISFPGAPGAVDTLIVLPIPTSAEGDLQLQAVARTATSDSAASAPVALTVLSATGDATPPVVTFSVDAPARAELDDSVSITVWATDSTRVAEVGVTVLPTRRLATGTVALPTLSLISATDSATFSFSLTDLYLSALADTSTLRLEVTGFASDTAGNCAAAVVANTPLSAACSTTGGATYGPRPGARTEILTVRGSTIALPSPEDRIADIASDGDHVFFSNISRSRLEVLDVGDTEFSGSIPVGSRPWGLAFNADSSLLYVANSAASYITRVNPVTLQPYDTLQTPNVKLYDVTFESKAIPDPDNPGDSIPAIFPTSVVKFDYSDRPQYIGVTANDNVVYSTLPTDAARPGTIRIYNVTRKRLEIITQYAENRLADKVVILNADSAFLVDTKPDKLIRVCPRIRSLNPVLDFNLPIRCYTGDLISVEDSIDAAGYDTKFLYGIDANEISLTDTTFVAVSGDHEKVAVGEGVVGTGRVVVLSDPPGTPIGTPLVKSGEISDLVGNSSARVVGLALNRDGSLGLAAGDPGFFFDDNLRLQGEAASGSAGGGADMHPLNPTVQRAFISGVDAFGLPYIDVFDTSEKGKTQVSRIYLRDPVIGALRAVTTSTGDVKIYAVTTAGIVEVNVMSDDL